MAVHSRRGFVKFAAAAGAWPVLGPGAFGRTAAAAAAPAFDLGIASYTFRSFPLDQVIALTQRLRIKKLTLKDMHLPMAITADEMAAVHAKFKAAGLILSSCGVVYMTTEDEVNKAFAYAKLAGITMMVGVPDAPLLALSERKCKEMDIALAIHNHGPTDNRYPSPESAYTLISKMDRRMGLCIDVGHTQRLGLDPAEQCERYADRLLDVHIKDVSAATAAGTTVEIGSGVIDTPKLLRTLSRLKYAGTLHFEHEKDAKDPFGGVAESVGYVRGVLSAL
jgi:inosose dehydratase